MRDIKPGMAVEYTQTFRGMVVHVSDQYISVRNKNGIEYQIKWTQVQQVLNPEPPEGRVIAEIACPRCGATKKALCLDVRYNEPMPEVKHPHRQRTKAWVKKTGWTP